MYAGKKDASDVLQYIFDSDYKLSSEQSQKIIASLSDKGVVDFLMSVNSDRLKEIITSTNLRYVRFVRADIEKQLNLGHKEGFWQKYFVNHSLILSLVTPMPIVYYEDQPYFGGKAIDNERGSNGDFLYRNNATTNCTIIEIKKPSADLIDNCKDSYRNGVYSPSKDLSSAVVQVLNYKSLLSKNYYSLRNNGAERNMPSFIVNETPCIIITGLTKSLDDDEKRNSFELFRSNRNGVVIMTFDELLAKIDSILSFMDTVEPIVNVA